MINKGDIVFVADSEGVRDIVSALGNAIDDTTPIAILVNKGTASAAEVLTGALRDNQRANVAGEVTFGKGLIQTIVDLSDGSGVAVVRIIRVGFRPCRGVGVLRVELGRLVGRPVRIHSCNQTVHFLDIFIFLCIIFFSISLYLMCRRSPSTKPPRVLILTGWVLYRT